MLCVTIPFFRKCCRKLVKMRLTVIQHGERMWQEEVRKEVEKAGQNENAHQRDVACCIMNCVLRWDKAHTLAQLYFSFECNFDSFAPTNHGLHGICDVLPPLTEGEGPVDDARLPQGAFELAIDQSEEREKFARVGLSLEPEFGATKREREKKPANTKIMRASFLFVDLLTLWHCNWIIIIIAVNISNKPYCFLKKAEIFSRNLKKVSSNVYKILKFSSYFFKPLSVFEKFLIYSRCTSIYEFECVIY